MKDKVLVRRKNTPKKVRQQRKEVEVPTCVTRYRAGVDVVYNFDINKTDFEVDPNHLPGILRRCDMEVVSSLKNKDAKVAKVSEEAEVFEVKVSEVSEVEAVDSDELVEEEEKKE